MSELEILDLVRASVRADGSEAQPSSRHGGNSPIGTADPSISADGTKVAFTSDFLDLVPNDTNDYSDIFVRDLTTGAIERANTTADGAPSETGSPLLVVRPANRLRLSWSWAVEGSCLFAWEQGDDSSAAGSYG